MSLLDDLRNLLTKHLEHVSSLVNQGTVHLIEDHLTRLAAVGPDVVAAEEAVHKVLTELYTALNGAPAPAETPAVPVIVGEPGPELTNLPQAAPVEQAPAESVQPADTSWAAAPVEPEPAPEPAAEPPAVAEDTPADTAQ